MNLSDAISKILKLNNYENLSNSQIYSILSDYGVFKDYPNLRLVVKSALEYDLWQLLIYNKQEKKDIMKFKLINDGFTINVIQIILDSLQLNINNKLSSDNEIKLDNNKNSIDNKIYYNKIQDVGLYDAIEFMGIKLGNNLDKFKEILRQKNFKPGETKKNFRKQYYIEFKGTYIGFENCIIKVFFGEASKRVYKIEINKKFETFGFSQEYLNIIELYKRKYGIVQGIKYNADEAKIQNGVIFSLDQNNSITIENGYYYGIRIIYKNESLIKDEEKFIQEEKIKELKRLEREKEKLREKQRIEDLKKKQEIEDRRNKLIEQHLSEI